MPVLSLAFAVGGILAAARPVAGEDFCVENKVFSGNGKQPVSQSTTIFVGGMVYDYLREPDEVVVFDKAAGRFVLLDMDHKVRTEVTTKKVEDWTSELQRRAASHPDPFLKFLANPKFTETYDVATDILTLGSPWLTYRLVLAGTDSPAVAQQYQEFSDWYCRLNTVLNPGSKPPAARLAVNEALARRKATAREVYLTLTPKGGFPARRTKVRSEHQLLTQVAEADKIRVGQTRQFMAIFQAVSFEKYRETLDR